MPEHNLDLFNLSEWANRGNKETASESKPNEAMRSQVFKNDDTIEKIKAVVDFLSSHGIDITDGYDNWFYTAKAIANELGECGRGLFHQVSKQSSQYNFAECDKKYDQCLHDADRSIGIGSFFQLAKNHGVDLSAISKEMFKNQNAGVCPTCPNVSVGTNSDNNTTSSTYTSLKEIEYLQPIVPNETMGQVGQIVDPNDMPQSKRALWTFSDKICREDLPSILWPVYDCKEETESKDKLLLGTLNILSGLIGGASSYEKEQKGIYGKYDGHRVFANLNTIVFGPAATQKGDLLACTKIAKPIRDIMFREYQEKVNEYEMALAEYESQGKSNKNKADRCPAPIAPVRQDPFIAGNSSTSSLYRTLDANGGWGLTFETEGDTVSEVMKQDYGNYSDVWRKTCHHEPISMTRVNDKITIYIEEPRLSIFITCTGGQLPALFPSFENGLPSRFLFYQLPEDKIEFHNVFVQKEKTLDEIFEEIGHQFMPLYDHLRNRIGNPIQFVLSPNQERMFVENFQDMLTEKFYMLGTGIKSFVFRIANHSFRIAMVLSCLRKLSEWNNDIHRSIFEEDDRTLQCTEVDYHTALTIVECLIQHTAYVYERMAPKDDKNPFKNSPKQPSKEEIELYKLLPMGDFTTKEMLEIAQKNNISRSSLYRQLEGLQNVHFVIVPIGRGKYKKLDQPISKL